MPSNQKPNAALLGVRLMQTGTIRQRRFRPCLCSEACSLIATYMLHPLPWTLIRPWKRNLRPMWTAALNLLSTPCPAMQCSAIASSPCAFSIAPPAKRCSRFSSISRYPSTRSSENQSTSSIKARKRSKPFSAERTPAASTSCRTR